MSIAGIDAEAAAQAARAPADSPISRPVRVGWRRGDATEALVSREWLLTNGLGVDAGDAHARASGTRTTAACPGSRNPSSLSTADVPRPS